MEALQLDAQDYVFPVEARNIFENKNIIKAIHASQHTQRNYDLDKKIPIEERNPEELSHVEGVDENNNIKRVRIYPQKSKSLNLAFDVTPAKLVTGLITEKGVCEASEQGLKGLFK